MALERWAFSCGERLQQKSLPADVPGRHRVYTSSIFSAAAHRESPSVDERSVPENHRYCRISWLYEPVTVFARIQASYRRTTTAVPSRHFVVLSVKTGA